MSSLSMSDVASVIKEVAETCILPHYRHLHQNEIAFKSENNPVTVADLEAEIELTKRLTSLLPGSHVVGEETFAKTPDVLDLFEGEDPVWIIDPVDGTKAFISGYPFFGVIVALARKNQTLAGWLYDPSSEEFVIAERGAGAWHNDKRLQVKQPEQLYQMSGVLNTAYADELSEHSPYDPDKPTLHHALSSCHDYARLVVQDTHFSAQVPSIHFLGTFASCTPWDIAAGALIHHEAGGYTAHWEQDGFSPCHINRGFMSAPDKDSWMELREWLNRYSALPPL